MSKVDWRSIIIIDNALMGRIRKHINGTRKQIILMQDLKVWNKVCASLDVLEDTNNAIDYFCKTDYPDVIGGQYLFTYGLLQAMYAQQNAIKHIAEALGFSINIKQNNPKLKEITIIRADIAHPTDRMHGAYVTYLMQMSLNKNGFRYLSSNENGSKGFNTYSAINTQNTHVNEMLLKIVEQLVKEDRMIMEKFKDKKMIEIFSIYDYASEKLSSNETGIFEWANEHLLKIIMHVKEALDERYNSWEEVDNTNYLLKEIDEIFSLFETDGFIALCGISRIKEFMYQFLFFKMDELQIHCKEIDDSFVIPE